MFIAFKCPLEKYSISVFCYVLYCLNHNLLKAAHFQMDEDVTVICLGFVMCFLECFELSGPP